MKILIVHPFLLPGGAQNQIIELADRWVSSGSEVTLLVGKVDEESFPDIKKRGIKVIESGMVNFKLRYLQKVSTLIWQIKLIKKMVHSFDIIQFHNWPSYLSVLFLPKGLIDKYFWLCNEPTHYWLNDYPKFKLLKNIVKWITFPVEKVAMNRFNKIFVLSNFMKNLIRENYNMDSIVMCSGVDINKYFPDKSCKKIEEITLLTVNKNINSSIQILELLTSRIPERKFILKIIGKVDASIVNTTDLRIRPNIKLMGYVKNEELPNLYRGADFLLFTNKKEPWGLVLLEASACGTPVIAFNSGGPKDIIVNGYNGFLINSVEETIDILKSISPSKYKELQKNARENAIKNFTWDDIANKYIDYFMGAK